MDRSYNTVVVTGAGISTESGLPDFRSPSGIYSSLGSDKVLDIINIKTLRMRPHLFYEFFRKYFLFNDIKPNRGHLALAEMEKSGLIKAVVTQNIDNLHQQAESQKVIAVHGDANRFLCTRIGCYKVYNADYVRRSPGTVPTCAECGSVLRPDVVLFGEPIQGLRYVGETILGASVLLVIGTSLSVYPLAGFVEEYGADKRDLVIINKGPTSMDRVATVKLEPEHTGELLEEISNRLRLRR